MWSYCSSGPGAFSISVMVSLSSLSSVASSIPSRFLVREISGGSRTKRMVDPGAVDDGS